MLFPFSSWPCKWIIARLLRCSWFWVFISDTNLNRQGFHKYFEGINCVCKSSYAEHTNRKDISFNGCFTHRTKQFFGWQAFIPVLVRLCYRPFEIWWEHSQQVCQDTYTHMCTYTHVMYTHTHTHTHTHMHVHRHTNIHTRTQYSIVSTGTSDNKVFNTIRVCTFSTDFKRFRTMQPASSWKLLRQTTLHLIFALCAGFQSMLFVLFASVLSLLLVLSIFLNYSRFTQPLGNSKLLQTSIYCAFHLSTLNHTVNTLSLTSLQNSGTHFQKTSDFLSQFLP